MKTKICFKCHTEKPLDEFYKHGQMADGHLNKCKVCAKNDVNSHRAKYPDEHILRDRLRYENPKRRESCIRRAKANASKNRGKINIYGSEWDSRNKEKKLAHAMVGKFLLKSKPANCEKCGSSSSRIHGHHEDYSKPLVVVWLCPKCHGEAHRLSRESATIKRRCEKLEEKSTNPSNKEKGKP